MSSGQLLGIKVVVSQIWDNEVRRQSHCQSLGLLGLNGRRFVGERASEARWTMRRHCHTHSFRGSAYTEYLEGQSIGGAAYLGIHVTLRRIPERQVLMGVMKGLCELPVKVKTRGAQV
jgi:hypothetical protein